MTTGPSLRDLIHFFHFLPALKRWAKLDRPCRGWVLRLSSPRVARKSSSRDTTLAPKAVIQCVLFAFAGWYPGYTSASGELGSRIPPRQPPAVTVWSRRIEARHRSALGRLSVSRRWPWMSASIGVTIPTARPCPEPACPRTVARRPRSRLRPRSPRTLPPCRMAVLRWWALHLRDIRLRLLPRQPAASQPFWPCSPGMSLASATRFSACSGRAVWERCTRRG